MLGNLGAFLYEVGHLGWLPQELLHDGVAPLPLRDDGAKYGHSVQLPTQEDVTWYNINKKVSDFRHKFC
jgi:hypothetical protein